jgi:hypothetical protein
MADLTDAEQRVVLLLADAWNAFVLLPVEHADDINEFRATIHRAQEKMFARPAIRAMNAK